MINPELKVIAKTAVTVCEVHADKHVKHLLLKYINMEVALVIKKYVP